MSEAVPIVGYENLYSVTKDGDVWSHANRLHDGIWLKQSIRNGYPCVDLCVKNKRKSHHVHRIVAATFIENPQNFPQVNHKNGNKLDNRMENLEWCTASQNKKHSWDIGTTTVTLAKREASKRNAYKMLAARGIYKSGVSHG